MATAGGSRRASPPKITPTKEGVIVSHSEFILDAVPNQSWVLSNFNLITALQVSCFGGMFPWLSAISGSYEQYRFRRIRISYSGSTSVNNTGRVYICYTPDPTDPVPTDKSAVMSYSTEVDFPLWIPEAFLDIPPSMFAKRLFREKYTNIEGTALALLGSNASPQNLDPRLSSFGQVFFCMSNLNTLAAAGVGEFSVDYEVELFRPVVMRPKGSSISFSATGTPTVWWANATVSGEVTSLGYGAYYTTGAATVPIDGITFAQPGCYLIMFQFQVCTGFAPTQPVVAFWQTNVTVPVAGGGSASQIWVGGNQGALAGTQGLVAFFVTIVSANCFMTVNFTPTWTTCSSMKGKIIPMDPVVAAILT